MFVLLHLFMWIIFLRKLKHGSSWLGKLSLVAPRHHLRPEHPCPRREHEAVGLCEKPALNEVRVRLMLEATGEDPRTSKPIGFC
jgi:hypothetical protein